MDTIDIVGDEIWFGPWKLGRKPDAMPATQWDECQYLAGLDPAQIELEKEAAVKAREEELNAEMLDLQKELDAAQERIRELENEAYENAYDAGHADALKECKAADAKVQAMKQQLKRRMGK